MFETKYEDKRDTECEDNCEKVYATKCEQFMISDVRQTMTPSAIRYVICDMRYGMWCETKYATKYETQCEKKQNMQQTMKLNATQNIEQRLTKQRGKK